MFERYTEKARRVIFFARYEASQNGSTEIATEHLLLGLVRENKALFRWLPKANAETLRRRVEECSLKRPSIATNIDLPLSSEGKRVLKFAADEADRLAQRHIGTEHLLLGLLDEENCFGAQLLREAGADAGRIREQVGDQDRQQWEALHSELARSRDYRTARPGAIEIHGHRRNVEFVREAVQRFRTTSYHWEQRTWTRVDIAVEKKTGEISFDLRLAEDAENFELVKAGWKKDRCVICGWELFESQSDHGTGYTNGRDWICVECHQKFWDRPDFFTSAYSDIT